MTAKKKFDQWGNNHGFYAETLISFLSSLNLHGFQGKVDMDRKKVSSKSEEKMHTKMKMTSRRAENLVHVQQHRRKYFYKKKK